MFLRSRRRGRRPPACGFAIGYLRAFFLPATVFFGPLRVRALVRVRWPRTGRPRRWRIPLYVPISTLRLMWPATSRRRSPSTLRLASMKLRSCATSSSVRSRTRVSGDRPVCWQMSAAVLRPIPNTYVSEISRRFSLGMSTPASLAISLLALPLLVARVLADDPHRTVAADHLALLAHLLDRRSDLQRCSVPRYLYR